MQLSRRAPVVSLVLGALTMVLLGRTLSAGAGEKALKRPQEVDVDPDGSMSFGRLSKAPFDKSFNQPHK